MRKHLVRLSVALLTFLVGVSAVTLWLARPWHFTADGAAVEAGNAVKAADPLPMFYGPTYCTSRIQETQEEKAVRLAEEFVARNGYTDLPADKEHLSYESIEWSDSVEEMLKWRRDSLERKAYGIFYSGRSRSKGWTVVFRHKGRYGNHHDETGRAVTMDGNFENLRVEHKSFFLGKVEKKF